jgi:hypothetical protein
MEDKMYLTFGQLKSCQEELKKKIRKPLEPKKKSNALGMSLS